MIPAPELRTALCAAVAEGDARTAVYVDRATGELVRVRDGACLTEGLTAARVEDDEARFAEAPVVTVTDEFLWMEEFVAELGEPAVAALLDGRKGAAERFAARLAKEAPAADAAWQRFRAARIDELVTAFLAAL